MLTAKKPASVRQLINIRIALNNIFINNQLFNYYLASTGVNSIIFEKTMIVTENEVSKIAANAFAGKVIENSSRRLASRRRKGKKTLVLVDEI